MESVAAGPLVLYFIGFFVSIFAVAFFLRKAGRGWGSSLFGGLTFSCLSFALLLVAMAVASAIAGKYEGVETVFFFGFGPLIALGALWYKVYRQAKE